MAITTCHRVPWALPSCAINSVLQALPHSLWGQKAFCAKFPRNWRQGGFHKKLFLMQFALSRITSKPRFPYLEHFAEYHHLTIYYGFITTGTESAVYHYNPSSSFELLLPAENIPLFFRFPKWIPVMLHGITVCRIYCKTIIWACRQSITFTYYWKASI